MLGVAVETCAWSDLHVRAGTTHGTVAPREPTRRLARDRTKTDAPAGDAESTAAITPSRRVHKPDHAVYGPPQMSTAADHGLVDAPRARLLRHPAEVRQLGLVGTYLALMFAMYFVPAFRNVPVFVATCALSFLNSVVIHNHLHQGIFHAKALNMAWRCVLSFGALYPASANVASHNLVHHHFDDDGQPDWAAPQISRFRWHLLNLLHFPNVAGPRTFAGVTRWMAVQDRPEWKRQYLYEQVFAFGLTGLLLVNDFWAGLFFVVMPQLWGARGILRINLIQHDGCDTTSEWNHSRNFVGRAFNWIMCNNGYHTIHHNRAGMHWSELHVAHAREVVPRIDPRLDEPSMILYLARTFLFGRPGPDVSGDRAGLASGLDARDARVAQAAADAAREQVGEATSTAPSAPPHDTEPGAPAPEGMTSSGVDAVAASTDAPVVPAADVGPAFSSNVSAAPMVLPRAD
jgi:fatty acid desaturase